MSDRTRIEYLKKVFITGVYIQDTRQLALAALTAKTGKIFSKYDLRTLQCVSLLQLLIHDARIRRARAITLKKTAINSRLIDFSY